MKPHNRRIAAFCSCLVVLNLIFGIVSSENFVAQAAEGIGAPARDFTLEQGFNSPFGINIQAAARYGISGTMQIPLDAARNTGAGWNREELRWDIIEPTRGKFDWGFADEAITKSTDRGLNVVGLLAYNVNYGSGRAQPSRTLPDMNSWRNYISQVVNRYKERVKFWEIWNEPDDQLYLEIPDPVQRAAGYAQLLQNAYDVIKGIDPGAQVITGGVSGFGVPFMQEVVNRIGTGKFDILGIHPYVNFAASPESKYWTDTQVAYFMAFANRIGKPVWATEFGWNTTGAIGVNESQQGNYIARSYVAGLATGMKKMFVYQFHDDGTNSSDRYGIVRNNWTTPKTSYNVYKNLISRLNGAAFRQRFDPLDSSKVPIEGFEFGKSFGDFANAPSVVNTNRSTERAYVGTASLKVDYDFRGNSSNYIQLGRDYALPGQPTKIGFWIYGDSNGADLRILLKDAAGTTFYYDIGSVGPQGWQRREAWLPGETALNTPPSSQIRYPIRFDSIQMISRPNGTKYGGTVYIDDVYANYGPNIQGYRFERAGKAIDVLWSDGQGGGVLLPSNDGAAVIFDRFGAARTQGADGNGNLNLSISEDMIFVEHNARPLTGLTTGGAGCGVATTSTVSGTGYPNDFFRNLWNRYDLLATGARSYVWGPQPFATGNEFYFQALDGNAQNNKVRQVVYFDKSRMEITRISNDPNAPGYVTNGLLTVELVTGKMQLGDNVDDPQQSIQCPAAQVPVAGDPDDSFGPKYASLQKRLKDAPKPVGAAITETINPNGDLGSDGPGGVVGGYFEPITNHTIAKPFWDFLNDPTQRIWLNGQAVTGKLFDPYWEAPGLPITEAYWAKVKVGGVVKDVLIQAFQRRVLTYTPSNPAKFQVEWGNIGRHYFTWRYGNYYS